MSARSLRPTVAATVAYLVASVANADLIDRGGGLIYDDILDVTWTQDASLSGSRNWDDAAAWASDLTLGGATNWRLASMNVNGDDTIVDCSAATEFICRDNEYGYLFHQYGITSTNEGPFTNIANSLYWSGTEAVAPPAPANQAWQINMINGAQWHTSKVNGTLAWAVADGDVAAVPVPPAAWLFGSALGLLGWVRRKSA